MKTRTFFIEFTEFDPVGLEDVVFEVKGQELFSTNFSANSMRLSQEFTDNSKFLARREILKRTVLELLEKIYLL
jgi:uncharacterized membrane protein (UPF0182 family)